VNFVRDKYMIMMCYCVSLAYNFVDSELILYFTRIIHVTC
jgi:hypothetical protein